MPRCVGVARCISIVREHRRIREEELILNQRHKYAGGLTKARNRVRMREKKRDGESRFCYILRHKRDLVCYSQRVYIAKGTRIWYARECIPGVIFIDHTLQI